MLRSTSIYSCRSDLATVQEQYVALCHKKEQLSSELEEMERETLSSIQAALDKVGMVRLSVEEILRYRDFRLQVSLPPLGKFQKQNLCRYLGLLEI